MESTSEADRPVWLLRLYIFGRSRQPIELQTRPPLLQLYYFLHYSPLHIQAENRPASIGVAGYILAGIGRAEDLHLAMLGVNILMFTGLEMVELATRRERATAERRSILGEWMRDIDLEQHSKSRK